MRCSAQTEPSLSRRLTHPWFVVAVLVVCISFSAVLKIQRANALAGTAPSQLEPVVVYRGQSLPDTYNDRVHFWVRRFTTRDRHEFLGYLRRQSRYAGMIRQKLQERGMPEDLLYLAMIESGFRPGAKSSASAVGLWQFMGATARAYGLRVDPYVDERRDPIRATDAALDFLQDLHNHYGSWYLAAAAYNAGAGRVNQALAKHGERRHGEESLYWEIIDHLPRETRNYVPRILAARQVAIHADAYGLRADADATYSFERVWVDGGTNLDSVARISGLPERVLHDLNPHLIRGVVPPGVAPYPLRVPVGFAAPVALAIYGRRADRFALAE